ncbi:MAG: PHP domain-containing protein [Chloroflexota bacterium]|nr:PHP domain-containing protein [Chloroflexota bacterium]
MQDGRSFADLHVHSSASFDSLSQPAALVRAALQRGLTHLAITDHERLDGALRARDLAPPGLRVIVGEEVRTSGGDIIGLYLDRPVPAGLSMAEAAAAIREQGGLVGLPHPFDRFRSSGGSSAGTVEAALTELAGQVDFVEAHNGRALGGGNVRAAAFAAQHGLPGIAASDAHTVQELGLAYTILPGDPTSASEMCEALADARLVLGRASLYVRGWTPLAKLVQRMRGNGRAPGATLTTKRGSPPS